MFVSSRHIIAVTTKASEDMSGSILSEGSCEVQVRLRSEINYKLLGCQGCTSESVGGSRKCFNMHVHVKVHLYYVMFIPAGIVI